MASSGEHPSGWIWGNDYTSLCSLFARAQMGTCRGIPSHHRAALGMQPPHEHDICLPSTGGHLWCGPRMRGVTFKRNKVLGLPWRPSGQNFAFQCGGCSSIPGPGTKIPLQFSHSVVSNSLRPHELQHARPPCPSPTPGVHPNPCPSSQ